MKKRRRIVVNASTVLISGGYFLSINIIQGLIESDKFELFIVCPNRKKYSSCLSKNSHLMIVPRWQLQRIFRLILDNIWLPKLIRKLDPDLVFSLTNIPAKTSYRQFFLHDNPFFGEKKLREFKLPNTQILLHKLRSRVILGKLKYIDLLLVQSDYHRKKFLKILSGSIQIEILPPVVPTFLKSDADFIASSVPHEKKKILCLSRYYEHKNLEILVELGKLIQKLKLPLIIYLTLNENQHKKVRSLINSLAANKLSDTIKNIGKVKHENIQPLIEECDALLLPSLLESFSLVFMEAWAMQKPLFVSNVDSIRNTCGDAAFYFDPHSAKDILKVINETFSDPDRIKEVVLKGKSLLAEMPKREDFVNLVSRSNAS